MSEVVNTDNDTVEKNTLEKNELQENDNSADTLDTSSPTVMVLPLPLNLHSRHRDSSEIGEASNLSKLVLSNRHTVSPASSTGGDSGTLLSLNSAGGHFNFQGRSPCVMNLLPSPIPSVDLMTALATLKAEFIQNYIVAMINRKAKMSSEHHGAAMHKGLEDGRLDSQHMSGLYGHRSNSSASSSPPAGIGQAGPGGGDGGLVVPQPINAKHHGHHTNGGGGGGSGRKYQCKMCPQVGKIFGSKADLQLHTQIHMREAKPYKCAQCSKAFANSSYLSQHTRIHLGIKPYKCEICQRKFTQLSHLQQHIRTHTGDKPYKCRHHGCTKAFSQLSNLQSHSRCHQTDKPYKCNSCYKCFIDETALLEHIPKHKESKHLKTHICQFCGKSYTQETYLAKHMQKHSDRPEKRSSGILSSGGLSAGSGGNGGQGHGNVVSGGGATGGSQTAHGLPSAGGPESYWSKMDTAAAYAHDRAAADYAAAQSAALMDPRLNPHHRDMMVDPRHAAMEDLRAVHHSQLSAGGHGLGGYVDHSAKTSSAFSPIQGSMLQTASGGFPMSGSRGYSFYDPIGFPKHHSQVGFETKATGANCFPNQLISLSQIRNYAHQPSSDLLHSLKEKAGQVSQ